MFRLVQENGGNHALMCWDNIITFGRVWHNKIQSSNRFMIWEQGNVLRFGQNSSIWQDQTHLHDNYYENKNTIIDYWNYLFLCMTIILTLLLRLLSFIGQSEEKYRLNRTNKTLWIEFWLALVYDENLNGEKYSILYK